MERFDLRLNSSRVTDLRRLAGKLSYESGVTVRWTDLVRLGVDLVLARDSSVPPTTGANNHMKSEKQ